MEKKLLSKILVAFVLVSFFAFPVRAATLKSSDFQTVDQIQPVVAIHVSEITQAFESMPASPPKGPGKTLRGVEAQQKL